LSVAQAAGSGLARDYHAVGLQQKVMDCLEGAWNQPDKHL